MKDVFKLMNQEENDNYTRELERKVEDIEKSCKEIVSTSKKLEKQYSKMSYFHTEDLARVESEREVAEMILKLLREENKCITT